VAKFAVLWHAAAFSLAIGRALDPQMAQSPRLRAARAYPRPATAVRAKPAASSSSSVNNTGARYTVIPRSPFVSGCKHRHLRERNNRPWTSVLIRGAVRGDCSKASQEFLKTYVQA